MPGGCPWERRGSILGPPGRCFGYHFGAMFGMFFGILFGAISASFFNAIFEFFGSHFGVILETFWRRNCNMKSITFQRMSPGASGHPHRIKKLDFQWRVV